MKTVPGGKGVIEVRVGIVGAGIGGLYAALLLMDLKDVVVRTTIFELLPRTGGRIETVRLDEFNAECGPMRFEPESSRGSLP